MKSLGQKYFNLQNLKGDCSNCGHYSHDLKVIGEDVFCLDCYKEEKKWF